MKAAKTIATYARIREQPVWRLLAAANGPIILGLLETHLYEQDRSLPASIFYERIERDLEELRARGENLPQTAQAYAAQWLREGFLERRLPAGAGEEVFEISAAAATAIRFIAGLAEPRSAATESRLAVVIQQLVRLAEDTDPNPETRGAALLAERHRLDAEIEKIRSGRLETLPGERALERAREIIGLADDLASDFRRVRDEFEQLNRRLRENLIDHDGGRGEVLENLFAGVDVIAQSEEGRTFAAFWRLLTDPEQSATLDEAVDRVLSREFAGQLHGRERTFLLRLTRKLLAEGDTVHEVLQHFAGSLRSFVQSREYLEHRRVNQLLNEAQRVALTLKDAVGAAETLQFSLRLTSSRLQSVAQWVLFDPSIETLPEGMRDAEAPPISLEAVGDLVAQSEIDFRELKANIRAVLREQSQASIADVMQWFPAAQGLGSVVGYLALASRHGVPAGREETVEWKGSDEQRRKARIPAIFFLRERVDELA